MKIFPHLLARVGGLPFTLMQQLQMRNWDPVSAYSDLFEKIEVEKKQILHTFQSDFRETKDYQLRDMAHNMSRDFYNNRKINVEKFIDKAQFPEDQVLLKKLDQQVQQYYLLQTQLHESAKDFEQNYKEDLLNTRQLVQKYAQNEDLLKGVLQSSHSFYHRLQRYAQKDIHQFRKKEWQTERSLYQYLSRMATKTSPFSTFTTLTLLSRKGNQFETIPNHPNTSFVQTNNHLLTLLHRKFTKGSTIYRQLPVERNHTLTKQGNIYLFLKNVDRTESIERMEESEALNIVYNLFTHKLIVFKDVIYQLAEKIEAEKEVLEQFVLQLLETGFLILKWETGGHNWEPMLPTQLESLGVFDSSVEQLLTNLEQTRKGFEEGSGWNASTRLSAQQSIVSLLSNEDFGTVSPEHLFYEDVVKNHNFQLSQKEIQPIINSLDQLLRWLEPLVYNEWKEKVRQCWLDNFIEKEEISLLQFYEVFFQQFSDISLPDKEGIGNLRQQYQQLIGTAFQQTGESQVNFNIQNFEIKNAGPQQNCNIPYAGLLQFFQKEKEWKGVLNGVAPGFGKLFGRFLWVFPHEITKNIRNWNKTPANEELWVENQDGSYFNANLHTGLLGYKMESFREANQPSPMWNVPIMGLILRWDKELQQPILVFTSYQQRVRIFDFGFEHPDHRSPMYQLLNTFGFSYATHRIFLNLANDILKKKKNGIVYFPRITINGHLILQRRHLIIPVELFPVKYKNETDASYFLKVQLWRKKHQLPTKNYLRIQSSENKKNKNIHKPQFIDFCSPLSVILFEKIIRKSNDLIKVEEMLPDEKELLNSDGQPYVTEFAIQWKKEK